MTGRIFRSLFLFLLLILLLLGHQCTKLLGVNDPITFFHANRMTLEILVQELGKSNLSYISDVPFDHTTTNTWAREADVPIYEHASAFLHEKGGINIRASQFRVAYGWEGRYPPPLGAASVEFHLKQSWWNFQLYMYSVVYVASPEELTFFTKPPDSCRLLEPPHWYFCEALAR